MTLSLDTVCRVGGVTVSGIRASQIRLELVNQVGPEMGRHTCRGEIRTRMTCGDMYTVYAINKFTRAEAKVSGHMVSICNNLILLIVVDAC